MWHSSIRKIFWTAHSKVKMRQYGLSAGKILQVLRKPERKEKGIAPGCTALMQTRKSAVARPGEIWLMYKDTKDARKIISCWRYPGISKPGESIPIPLEIKEALSHGDF